MLTESAEAVVQPEVEGRRIEVRGTVQGVGFRPWVYRLAVEAGLTGRVANDAAGVWIEAYGPAAALDAFVRRLRAAPPPAAVIRRIACHPIGHPGGELLPRAESGVTGVPAAFTIAPSTAGKAPGEALRLSIPPDLATCPACQAEIFDRRDRRYRYAFTSCAYCGPRFTIAQGVPYDRAATTMAAFTMCPECQAEYDDPADRRFHAQPNACPRCGPRLWPALPGGAELALDPLDLAGRFLAAGLIVAVKGIGGFHLACRAAGAGAEAALARLRRLKGRQEKPFAVMVRDEAAALRFAALTAGERRLLAAVERPIVLAAARPGSGLAAAVAPGSARVGLLLPYSPLHHLLLAELDFPLVLTSGNVSEEPIARDNDEALARLGKIADLFLFHDRAIESRADDSVAQVIAGRPTVFRRSRGYVPRPIPLARPFARPVLACGGNLKNTFCLGVGDAAYLGPHAGDLDNLAAFEAYEAGIARLSALLAATPEVVAYDLHPQYLSTEYALARPETLKIAVQHHHAHTASTMAEHGLACPVLGVVFDGTGYGTDGTAWGGELLLATYGGYRRLATFRPIALAGGDLAVREVWRIALALLDDAFAGSPSLDRLPVFAGLDPERVAAVRRMLAAGVHCPKARGVGRLFDALGALCLGRPESHYEGQIALEWNHAADPHEHGLLPIAVDFAVDPWEVDPRLLVRALVFERFAGTSVATLSARFHNTLATTVANLLRAARERVGDHPVVLSGGCFQNALLVDRALAAISALPTKMKVYLHREVPPGDGGLALGQALVADAVARGEGGPSCA